MAAAVGAASLCCLLAGCSDDEPSSEHDAEWAATVCKEATSGSDPALIVTETEPISAAKARDLKGADMLPSIESDRDLALCTVVDSRLPSGARMLADQDGNSAWVVVSD